MNDNMNKVEIIIVHCIDLDLEGNDNNKKNSSSSSNNSVSSSSSSSSIFTDTLKQELCLLDNNPNKDKKNDDSNNITLNVIDYTDGGGRGPCLNYGAFHSTGRILTFLHADTYLNTKGWNNAIIDTLFQKQKNNTTRITTTTTCCAFSFAIEKKESSSRTPQKKGIPGITAIEYTANLRTKFFQLPYGDQCLSLPSSIFQSIGGYPDQCLFEDYELVRLEHVL